MTKLIIQVRTADNLLDLLKANKSGNWVVAQGKEQEITDVEIVSFDGTQKIEGTFDVANSFRLEDGRLVIAFTNAYIQNCSISFDGRNPVRYFWAILVRDRLRKRSGLSIMSGISSEIFLDSKHIPKHLPNTPQSQRLSPLAGDTNWMETS